MLAPDGVELAVEVKGEGKPTTVFGHGLTGSRRDFQLVTDFLPGTRVLFDFRGHGESADPDPGAYSMERFAGDLDAVARAHDATCAAGISLGAGAILRLLSRDPGRFERVVLLQPARLDRSSEAHRRMQRLSDALRSLPLEAAAEEILRAEAAEGAFDEWGGQRQLRRENLLGLHRAAIPYAIEECIDDPPVADPALLRDVTAPAMVVAHEGDPVHDAGVARELARALPIAELLVFPSYRALLEETPAVVQKVGAFLAS
jgi:pimeloyl-ACP methyl ester carboxylesterase